MGCLTTLHFISYKRKAYSYEAIQANVPVYTYRLQQPVQNPISDNTNVLWNSPSLGKNYSYRLPLVL